MTAKDRSFSRMMEEVLNERLKVFVNETPNRTCMMKIYTTIFNVASDVFQKANVRITNEAMNFVAQSYYESLDINGKNEVNDQVYTQLAKLENIPNHELVMLTKLWKDHTLGQVFVTELKRRS